MAQEWCKIHADLPGNDPPIRAYYCPKPANHRAPFYLNKVLLLPITKLLKLFHPFYLLTNCRPAPPFTRGPGGQELPTASWTDSRKHTSDWIILTETHQNPYTDQSEETKKYSTAIKTSKIFAVRKKNN